MEHFDVSRTVALVPLTMYVLALGAGPVLGAPFSETYGRYLPMAAGPALALPFTIGCGFSPNIGSLIVCRFFAGLFFSPVLAIGGGINADCFRQFERGPQTIIFITMPFMGPAIGPVIGGFAIRKGWQWVYWTHIFFAIVAEIGVLFTSESHKATILKRRNAKLGLPPPPFPFPNQLAYIKFMLMVTLFRPIHMMFTEPIVAFLSLYTAFNFGVLFTFFAAFPFTFGGVYGFTTEQSGLVFIAIGLGCLIALPTLLYLDKRVYGRAHARSTNGVTAPEFRLAGGMAGAFALPVGLFWFAWSARPSVHWIVPIISAVPFAWGNVNVFITAGMYLTDTYGALNGASAIAANGLLRYVFAAAFPLFTVQMYSNLGIGWATSLLGFVCVALIPIPWILWYKGGQIRALSKYETIKA
jgi:MFS family permease